MKFAWIAALLCVGCSLGCNGKSRLFSSKTNYKPGSSVLETSMAQVEELRRDKEKFCSFFDGKKIRIKGNVFSVKKLVSIEDFALADPDLKLDTFIECSGPIPAFELKDDQIVEATGFIKIWRYSGSGFLSMEVTDLKLVQDTNQPDQTKKS